MRSVRAVYKKLKEVKYRHLALHYKTYFKRYPTKCRYNRGYSFIGEDGNNHEIRLCLLHQPNLDIRSGVFPHLVDVCQEMNHCRNCDAFTFLLSEEDIKKSFEEELKDHKIKMKKYPDICALEWVLEQSVVGIPPFNWIQKVWYTTKRVLTRNKIL